MAKEKTVIIDDTSEEMTENILKSINICFEAANIKTFKILEDFVAGGYEEFIAKILVYLPEKKKPLFLSRLFFPSVFPKTPPSFWLFSPNNRSLC